MPFNLFLDFFIFTMSSIFLQIIPLTELKRNWELRNFLTSYSKNNIWSRVQTFEDSLRRVKNIVLNERSIVVFLVAFGSKNEVDFQGRTFPRYFGSSFLCKLKIFP